MRRVLPSRSDATSVLLCKASIRYLFAWKEIKPARKKGKEKERERERERERRERGEGSAAVTSIPTISG